MKNLNAKYDFSRNEYLFIYSVIENFKRFKEGKYLFNSDKIIKIDYNEYNLFMNVSFLINDKDFEPVIEVFKSLMNESIIYSINLDKKTKIVHFRIKDKILDNMIEVLDEKLFN